MVWRLDYNNAVAACCNVSRSPAALSERGFFQEIQINMIRSDFYGNDESVFDVI